MSAVAIKICGLTTPADARVAVEEGVDAIGVNLWPQSKRFVTDERAAEVLAVVPRGVLKVGVFVNLRAEEVARRMDALGLDRAQLHGDERAGDYVALEERRMIRVVRVRDEASFLGADGWHVPLFMYDAHVGGYGGAGVTAPWDLIARLGRRPFWLAGGLTAENVEAAIASVRPDGVDVASGVESAPGVKDPHKVAAFIAAVRAARGGL